MSVKDSGEPQEADEQPKVEHNDWFLQILVKMANRNAGLSITLSVKGLLISGQLISGKTYFEKFGDQMDSVFSQYISETEDRVGDSFRVIAKEIYPENIDNQEDEAKAETPKPHYIHLDDARFLPQEIPKHFLRPMAICGGDEFVRLTVLCLAPWQSKRKANAVPQSI